MDDLMTVEDLVVDFPGSRGGVRALDGVSLVIQPGEACGVVGESGSGKSTLGMAMADLLAPEAHISSGAVTFGGRALRAMSARERRGLRGTEIGVIFQDPMSSLNPSMRVGPQIREGLTVRLGMSRRQATERTIELLDLVGIPNPKERFWDYPHQFSGGMRQRVMIAIGVSCEPSVLIADEPTTALDVTLQAEILALLGDLRARLGVSLVLISHDVGVIAEVCDRVGVMYAGRFVEMGAADQVLRSPQHPYTRGLLASVPTVKSRPHERLTTIAGTPPRLSGRWEGCGFEPRCEWRVEQCRTDTPELEPHQGRQDAQLVRCWVANAPPDSPIRPEGDVHARG